MPLQNLTWGLKNGSLIFSEHDQSWKDSDDYMVDLILEKARGELLVA